tara:strand:- start:1181 stop:1630 length:450 start_codon:yes stop_codon:yes gene_type:complete
MSLPVGLSFVRTINGKYVTIIDEYQCRRYLCFTSLKVATKCIDYHAEFRSKHGYWPEIDLGKQKNEIEVKEFKKRSPEKLKKYFDIEFHNQKDADDVCSIYNAPYFICHDFQYNVGETDFQLFLSAQAIDCTPPDMYQAVSQLNRLLNL